MAAAVGGGPESRLCPGLGAALAGDLVGEDLVGDDSESRSESESESELELELESELEACGKRCRVSAGVRAKDRRISCKIA